jgi:hypothetical protein
MTTLRVLAESCSEAFTGPAHYKECQVNRTLRDGTSYASSRHNEVESEVCQVPGSSLGLLAVLGCGQRQVHKVRKQTLRATPLAQRSISASSAPSARLTATTRSLLYEITQRIKASRWEVKVLPSILLGLSVDTPIIVRNPGHFPGTPLRRTPPFP